MGDVRLVPVIQPGSESGFERSRATNEIDSYA
jgi:hypothetical protein